MARKMPTKRPTKRPTKKSAGAKAAKTGAARKSAKKAANKSAKQAVKKVSGAIGKKASKGRKPAAKAVSPSTSKTLSPPAKKVRAAKAARRAAVKAVEKARKRPGAKSTTGKSTASKSTAGKSAAGKSAANKSAAKTSQRRAAPRNSAGRRASARKTVSREALVKKTVTKPAAPARKAAKTRAAKRTPASKTAGKTAGKTARSRIVVRAARKLAPPVLRDGARRRVAQPTAPRPGKLPAVRRAPLRLHALGLRDEHPTDQPRVAALLLSAFARRDEAAIVERLRADGDIAFALVAEYESEIVGHIAFSRAEASIDGRPVKALALAPLAVLPGRQGRGVGSVLVAAGLEAARDAGFEAVFVVGDAAYYERFGFSAAAAQPFESEWKSALMAIELGPRALAGHAGSLIHPGALRG